MINLLEDNILFCIILQANFVVLRHIYVKRYATIVKYFKNDDSCLPGDSPVADLKLLVGGIVDILAYFARSSSIFFMKSFDVWI